MSGSHRVTASRVYDTSPDDGHRVLVDRLWPRGFRKGDPRIDQWIRDVAASTELRKWYSHRADRFDEFVARYAVELESGAAAAALEELRDAVRAGPVTLVTATRDLDGSHAAVLVKLLS